MKPKHQRLVLGLLALGAVAGAAGLALSALQDQAAFFYAPGDVAGKPVPTDGRFCQNPRLNPPATLTRAGSTWETS